MSHLKYPALDHIDIMLRNSDAGAANALNKLGVLAVDIDQFRAQVRVPDLKMELSIIDEEEAYVEVCVCTCLRACVRVHCMLKCESVWVFSCICVWRGACWARCLYVRVRMHACVLPVHVPILVPIHVHLCNSSLGTGLVKGLYLHACARTNRVCVAGRAPDDDVRLVFCAGLCFCSEVCGKMGVG